MALEDIIYFNSAVTEMFSFNNHQGTISVTRYAIRSVDPVNIERISSSAEDQTLSVYDELGMPTFFQLKDGVLHETKLTSIGGYVYQTYHPEQDIWKISRRQTNEKIDLKRIEEIPTFQQRVRQVIENLPSFQNDENNEENSFMEEKQIGERLNHTEAHILDDFLEESLSVIYLFPLPTELRKEFLVKSVTEESYTFHHSLDLLYFYCKDLQNKEIIHVPKYTNEFNKVIPARDITLNHSGIELIKALKMINDFCFNNELLYGEYGKRKALAHYFGSFGKSSPEIFAVHVNSKIFETIRNSVNNKETDMEENRELVVLSEKDGSWRTGPEAQEIDPILLDRINNALNSLASLNIPDLDLEVLHHLPFEKKMLFMRECKDLIILFHAGAPPHLIFGMNEGELRYWTSQASDIEEFVKYGETFESVYDLPVNFRKKILPQMQFFVGGFFNIDYGNDIRNDEIENEDYVCHENLISLLQDGFSLKNISQLNSSLFNKMIFSKDREYQAQNILKVLKRYSIDPIEFFSFNSKIVLDILRETGGIYVFRYLAENKISLRDLLDLRHEGLARIILFHSRNFMKFLEMFKKPSSLDQLPEFTHNKKDLIRNLFLNQRNFPENYFSMISFGDLLEKSSDEVEALFHRPTHFDYRYQNKDEGFFECLQKAIQKIAADQSLMGDMIKKLTDEEYVNAKKNQWMIFLAEFFREMIDFSRSRIEKEESFFDPDCRATLNELISIVDDAGLELSALQIKDEILFFGELLDEKNDNDGFEKISDSIWNIFEVTWLKRIKSDSIVTDFEEAINRGVLSEDYRCLCAYLGIREKQGDYTSSFGQISKFFGGKKKEEKIDSIKALMRYLLVKERFPDTLESVKPTHEQINALLQGSCNGMMRNLGLERELEVIRQVEVQSRSNWLCCINS